MEVNQVKFGNYTIGNPAQRSPKGNEQPAEETNTQASGGEFKSVNRDDLLDAMNLAGLQNMSQISSSARLKDVDPTEFLDEGRIADIEAMMAEFETGVNQVADAIGQEFPELSEANRNALAARIFAKE